MHPLSTDPGSAGPKKANNMKHTILILDDNDRRLNAMRAVTAAYPDCEAVLTYDAPHTIAWLKDHLSSAALISLDHDLGPHKKVDGRIFDPGTGMDVVDYLTAQDSSCPVIVHTSSWSARDRMVFALEASGWDASFVIPYGDLDWINETWQAEVENFLARFAG